MPSNCSASARATASLRLLAEVERKATSVLTSKASGFKAKVSPNWLMVRSNTPCSTNTLMAARHKSAAIPLDSNACWPSTASVQRSYQVGLVLPASLSKCLCWPSVSKTGLGVYSPILGIHSARPAPLAKRHTLAVSAYSCISVCITPPRRRMWVSVPQSHWHTKLLSTPCMPKLSRSTGKRSSTTSLRRDRGTAIVTLPMRSSVRPRWLW